MGNAIEAILGIILGGIAAYWCFNWMSKKQGKQRTEKQAVILLDKIKRVCKLITVEGDFSEIYHYQDTSARFFKLIPSKKKALLVITAKASVGYDLSKIKIQTNTVAKSVTLTAFPQPEVLSIATDIKYYDKQDGMFNKFGADDLTNLSQEAKAHIEQKIPESGLIDEARKEALESILLIEAIVATIGWTLDYSALELPDTIKKQLL